MVRAALLALLTATLCTACGKDTTTSPSTTTTDPARFSDVFGGTLAVGQSQFYSFTVGAAGSTEVTLLSLRPSGVPTTTLSTVVGLGLGTPQGTDCALRSATTTTPALARQLTVTTEPSIYCVKVADIGFLSGAVDYTVRVLHP
jgi:hypothetical protein